MNEKVTIGGFDIGLSSFNTIIVGTGAAGYNAADRLYSFGQTSVAMITEHVNTGTSRNTGSDKQTYYKLSLSGGDNDSVMAMAKTLFDGQCMDGDLALAEAAMSVRCFMRLAELGVPFPTSRYGEYVGYKTDHDPARRAASAGPLTSKLMTEALERSVNAKNIPVFNCMQVISILTENEEARGVLCLNLGELDTPSERFKIFLCKNIVWAVGGPAGMYSDSVYPLGHYGASGIAFEAGVKGRNLTEWQYGLASLKPRWNVSGTYMQALPRFISTDEQGGDEREFLLDYFTDSGDMLTQIFLKGYEWPFDARRASGGSSIIDILVYIETRHKDRRVFLDYRKNPFGKSTDNGALDFSQLGDAAKNYLKKAGAMFGTPIQRLRHMNAPAYDFYRSKCVDLDKDPLEIALCAQHNNGGLAVNIWWQTNITGFFAVGEAAGSHGVYRPGGSALNAGQAGSSRAAMYICHTVDRMGKPVGITRESVDKIRRMISLSKPVSGESTVDKIWSAAQRSMSSVGAAIRDKSGIKDYLSALERQIVDFGENTRIGSSKDLPKLYRLYDMLISQKVYLSSMVNYMENGGKSRGSALYLNPAGACAISGLTVCIAHDIDDGSRSGLLQEAAYSAGEECSFTWRSVHPIPQDDDFFENVWRGFRENGNIF